MSRYDDIINLPHPDLNHPRMSMEKRAAQFAPFSALSGHGEAISETARQTESKIELTAEEQSKLSKQLIYALERGMEVKIIHFKPDVAKEGGRYESTKG
ncbi:MAG: hypothetical protein K2H15_01360, partial [Muribaculaceae bacterium]|nr:hypothetical protein [Muribaculaceae bacterium]